jgi:hypothetical protein
MFVGGMIGSLLVMNQSTQQGFALRGATMQKERLQETVSALERQMSQLQAVDAVSARVSSMGLVPIDHVQYVGASPLASLAAARR